MHSSKYELVVEDYLVSRSRSMLVRPQYWLRAARKQRAPDVLAVDMKNKVIYLAEVTANKNPKQLLDKLQDYRDGNARILAGLKREFGLSGDWSVEPWLFIWDDIPEPLKASIEAFGAKTTWLKELIASPPKGIDAVPEDWGMTPA